jgi:micrococcal nuclease
MFLIIKTGQFILIVIILFFLTATFSHSEQSFGDYERAVYVRNYDGDTITFNLPNLHPIIGKKISIRVNGIDTAEIRGKCDKEKYNAKQAKDMVAEILKDAERIDLKNMRRGKYFRIAADVYVDGENLAEALIDSGMAVKYDGGKKNTSWCE